MMERQLGRESQKDNDLFYTCSLIDYIARKTKNKRVAVVDALGILIMWGNVSMQFLPIGISEKYISA